MTVISIGDLSKAHHSKLVELNCQICLNWRSRLASVVSQHSEFCKIDDIGSDIYQIHLLLSKKQYPIQKSENYTPQNKFLKKLTITIRLLQGHRLGQRLVPRDREITHGSVCESCSAALFPLRSKTLLQHSWLTCRLFRNTLSKRLIGTVTAFLAML